MTASAKTLRALWVPKEYDYRDRAHYVDAVTKKILGGVERTYDDFWEAWLTVDGKPRKQLGEYTEKDAAIRAVQIHAAALKRKRTGRAKR